VKFFHEVIIVWSIWFSNWSVLCDSIISLQEGSVQEIHQHSGTSEAFILPRFYQVGGPSGITWDSPSGQRRFDGDTSGLGLNEYVLTQGEIQAQFDGGHP